jgi:hypothetical protein
VPDLAPDDGLVEGEEELADKILGKVVPSNMIWSLDTVPKSVLVSSVGYFFFMVDIHFYRFSVIEFYFSSPPERAQLTVRGGGLIFSRTE